MSNRSRAAYYAQIERVYSHCQNPTCFNIGARYSKKDGKTLCKHCRATKNAKQETQHEADPVR
jgi:hypothetical protein